MPRSERGVEDGEVGLLRGFDLAADEALMAVS